MSWQPFTDHSEAVIRAHASPLSQIPNAGWGAGYSRLLWTFYQEFRGNITIELPKIHEKLGKPHSTLIDLVRTPPRANRRMIGPLIRIGPNEVSFYSIDIYDTLHKVNSGFVKDPRNYGEFVQDGHPALFSITYMMPKRCSDWVSPHAANT